MSSESSEPGRFVFPFDIVTKSWDRTQVKSSIAAKSHAQGVCSGFNVFTHHKSVNTTSAKLFDPPCLSMSQLAFAGGSRSRDSPSRQAGCIVAHHLLKLSPKSFTFTTCGGAFTSFLRLIHQLTSARRDFEVNNCVGSTRSVEREVTTRIVNTYTVGRLEHLICH